MLEKKVYLYYLSSVFIINCVVVVVIEVDIFVAVLEELQRYDIFWVKSSSYIGLSRLYIFG